MEIFVTDEFTVSGRKLLYTFNKYLFDTGCTNTGIYLKTRMQMLILSHMTNTKTSANGISTNGRYCVQIAGMPEPVEVKCLEMLANEPDTDENSILLGADVIFIVHHSGLG